MTIGQRIAQKRKELGLSQEGLGEQLGVSRQAIYKWESDATLPEIEKLISLSRIFSVPVGWLLGEEQEENGGSGGKELTEDQLRMVQEIVDRYLDAQPEPEPPQARRWPWIVLVACVAMVCLVFINLFDRLDQVTNNYNNLQHSISNVQNQVANQIGSITNRVEEILHSQNELTAEWSTGIRDINIPENTVTFHVRVVPKTYQEGMTALFVARNGETVTEVPVTVGGGNAFEGIVTCALTDDIDLTVVFLKGDQRQTQVLEQYDSLYSSTFPGIIFMGNLWMEERDGVIPANGENKEHFFHSYDEGSGNPWQAKAVDIKVGLFKDGTLVQWYREEMREGIYNGVKQERAWYCWDETVLDEGSVYCEAAVITDEYGRVRVYADTAIRWSAGDWHHVVGEFSSDPADWEF